MPQDVRVLPDGKSMSVADHGGLDMGHVSADGRYRWPGGRYEDTVYRFSTDTGALDKIKAGRELHGRAVWPQAGRSALPLPLRPLNRFFLSFRPCIMRVPGVSPAVRPTL